MPNQTARFDGLTEGLAVKRAVRVATTANITLSGLQTVDGIVLAADDRVLVKDQSTQAQNGIYNASSGPWPRARDADGNGDWCQGTRVLVNSGTLNARKEYALTTADPIVLDTSAMTFTQIPAGADTAGFIVSDMTLAVPGTYATTKLALAYLDNKIIASNALVTIEVTGHVSTSDSEALMTVRHPNANRIRLRGASAQMLRTIQASGHTVTGTYGNWSVTMKLDSVTGITAGDVIRIGVTTNDNPGPSDLTTTYAPTNLNNDLYHGIESNRTASIGFIGGTVGTTMTIDQTYAQAAAPPLTDDWLVFANGESREIADDSGAPTTYILSSAFTQDITLAQGQAYWYRIKKAAGTIGTGGVASTTITGSSTDFTSRCTIGDLVCVNGEFRRITAVNSDTDITVSHNITITNGTVFGIYTMHEAHVGAFKITSVDTGASTITYTNKTLGPQVGSDPTPPIKLGANQLKGGTVEILRDTIENTHASGDGIVIAGGVGLYDIDNIGIIGGGVAGGDALCSSTRSGSGFGTGGNIKTGDSVGVTNWGQAVRCQAGSASIQYLCVGNCAGSFALYAHQGSINADYACVSGYAVFGAFIGPGGGLRCSGAIFTGSRFSSIYNNGGGAVYADGARSYAARIGYQAISGGGGHMVEFRALCNTLMGVALVSGGDVRIAGLMALGTGYTTGLALDGGIGLSVENVNAETTFAWIGGSLSYGALAQYGDLIFTYSAATGNALFGVAGIQAARMRATNCYITKNNGGGVLGGSGATINAQFTWSDDNTSSDYLVSASEASIDITGSIGTPVLSPVTAANTRCQNGSFIYNSGATGFSARKSPTHLYSAAAALDFNAAGALGAGLERTLTATIQTAAAGDIVNVVRVTGPETGLAYDGWVSAGNTVTVRCKNFTTGGITPAVGTFNIEVIKLN